MTQWAYLKSTCSFVMIRHSGFYATWTKRACFSAALVIIWTTFALYMRGGQLPTRFRHSNLPSVNLVFALTKDKDYSWTSSLPYQNLRIIPFIADDPTAEFHPQVSKGREAIMYLSHIVQFYELLPDISIFVHGDDVTWHIDQVFDKSTAYAVNHL